MIIKGKALRQDFAQYDGITLTGSRKDSTGGFISGLRVGDEVDVLMVYGQGENYNNQTIQNAITSIGSKNVTLKFTPGTWAINADVTIPSNLSVSVPAGVVFNVASGKTLTFQGPVFRDSETWTSGSGTVTETWSRSEGGAVTFNGTVTFGGSLVGLRVTNLQALRDAAASILSVGVAFALGHTTAGDGGHGNFRYVSGASAGTYTDNGGTIILPTGGNGSAAWLRVYSGPVYVKWFGAAGDSSTDDTSAIQSAINAAIATKTGLVLDDGEDTATEYRITSKLTVSDELSITGSNPNNVTLLCVGTSGIEFAAGVIRCTLQGFGLAASVRHTDTSNVYAAITFLGNTSSRPYWNTIENLFIDGFFDSIKLEWTWETTIRNIKAVNCGHGIRATGISVNNWAYGNSFDGNDILIDLGDATNTIEGWHIFHNFTEGGRPYRSRGASYCWFEQNVCDHITGATAVLFQSGTGLPSIGNKINGNYIAFDATATADEGIRLLNNVSSSANHGSHVADNIIFPYSGGSLTRGILIDGTGEENNFVLHNNVNASTEDCKIDGATGTVVDGNIWQGGGFRTDTQCIYKNNTGTIITSETLHNGVLDIRRKLTALSNAQLQALAATPVTVVAAPGTGKFIHVLSWRFRLIFVTTAIDDAAADGNLILEYAGGSTIDTMEADGLVDAAATTQGLSVNLTELIVAETGISNTAVQISNSGAEFTVTGGGDSTAEVEVFYRVLDSNPS